MLLPAAGLEGRMLDSATDWLMEISAFVEMTDNEKLPRSVEAINSLLTELHEVGLVAPQSRRSRAEAGFRSTLVRGHPRRLETPT